MISKELLKRECMKFSVDLTDKQADMFDCIAKELILYNEKINVTAVTDPDEIVKRHFVDSVAIMNYMKFTPGSRIIDVGTGAGFPALPLAVCLPDCEITAVDSVAKKLGFINNMAKELGLNCRAVSARAEDLAHDATYRESFDYAVSRAVARLNVIEELTVPFVKPCGYTIIYKSKPDSDELSDGEYAAKKLGCETEYINYNRDGERTFVKLKKIKSTENIYPRAYSKIKKSLP